MVAAALLRTFQRLVVPGASAAPFILWPIYQGHPFVLRLYKYIRDTSFSVRGWIFLSKFTTLW